MGPAQWEYNKDLACLAGIPEIPLSVETLYKNVTALRQTHLATYKTLKLDQVKLLNLEVEASERCFVVSKRKRGFFRWTAS